MTMTEAQQHWEERYGAKDRIWSGRVNPRLAETAAALPPGRALDLGCGEGGDVIWLAEHGWQVLGVDISTTALSRAAEEVANRGLTDDVALNHVDLNDCDLAEDLTGGQFDLVSAQFLHSMVWLDRQRILRQAAAAVAPGGSLLIVDHGQAPPWADKLAHEHHFPSAEEVVAQLGLDSADWERVRVEAADREAIGPDGQPGVLTDNIIHLRRRA